MSYQPIENYGVIGNLRPPPWSAWTVRSTGSACRTSIRPASSPPSSTTGRAAASASPRRGKDFRRKQVLLAGHRRARHAVPGRRRRGRSSRITCPSAAAAWCRTSWSAGSASSAARWPSPGVSAGLRLRPRRPQVHLVPGARRRLRRPGLSLDLAAPVPLRRDGAGVIADFTLREGETGRRSSCAASARTTGPGAARRTVRRKSCSATPLPTGGAGSRKCHVHRPLAGDGPSLGPDAQAPVLRADRRDRRGARPAACPRRSAVTRNWDYRYTWIRDAAFSRVRPAAARLHRGSGPLPGLAEAPLARAPTATARAPCS